MNIDLRLVGGDEILRNMPRKEEEHISLEEASRRMSVLREKMHELISLPDDEFLSKEVQDELNHLNKEVVRVLEASRGA